MKNSLVSRLKSGLYTISTAAALGFGLTYCNRTPIEPSNLPQNVLDISPISGSSPLEVRVRGSCVDPDDDLKDYKIMYGSNILTTTNPTDTLVNLTQSASFSSYCEDMKGNQHNVGPINVQVMQPPPPDTTSKIAFWRVFEDYDDIALINEDGTGLQRLTTNPGQDLEPTWSPDGKELLFTSHRTGGTAVWRMDSDGSNQRDITSNIVERARQADWCSNGKIVVAYRHKGDSEAGIGIIDPNGISFTSIYSEPRTVRIPGWPKWSPSCSEVAFERYVNGNWEIYTMNSDGTNQRNIPNNLIVNDQQATWSPDGTKMVFISDRANPGGITNGLLDIDLYIMNNDGTNITRLTYDIGPEADPDWSNDGEKIIFAGGSTNNFHLYLINENGTNMVRLTNNGENRY